MRVVLGLLIFCCAVFFRPVTEKPSREFVINGTAQGTTYHIIYFAGDSTVLKSCVDSLLNSLDSSLSIYKPYSLISRFNHADRGLEIDMHFINVVKASLATYEATGGIFDITIAPLTEAWGFAAKHIDSLPDTAKVNALLNCVSSTNILLQGNYLRKQKPCVRVDVNGIAQGYSVDVLADFLEQKGVNNYLVELGGEIKVKGRKLPGYEYMKIGIETPAEDAFEEEPLQLVLQLDSGAITTSGNYRKFYESNGRKISHLIDPRTGYSMQNEMISATVYAKNAITADAFDNALMVMGLDSALHFTAARKDIAAYFIYKKEDGTVADTATAAFYKLMH